MKIFFEPLSHAVGKVVNEKGQSVLIQTDWDAPGVASTFGWSIASVQKEYEYEDDDGDFLWATYEPEDAGFCSHESTDGTVDCPDCRIKASEFISSALKYLQDEHGPVEDPGYFGN